MIKIVCAGKLKENYLKDACLDYIKRINKYHKLEVIELKEEKTIDIEGEKMLKLAKGDALICLDPKGKKLSSPEFARVIDKTFMENGNITFVIGSSLGLSEELKNKSNLVLSFSDLTFPHGLFRLILLEQIYRAFKINNNETYHK